MAVAPRLATIVAAITLLPTLPQPVDAQRLAQGLEGQRVRVAPLQGPRFAGTVESQSTDTLAVLETTGSLRAIALRDVSAIDRSLGSGSGGAGRGFGIGALGGLLGGLFLTEASCRACDDNGPVAIAAGGVGLLLGAVVGLIVDIGRSGERWEPVAILRDEDVTLLPYSAWAAGDPMLGLSLTLR